MVMCLKILLLSQFVMFVWDELIDACVVLRCRASHG